MKTLQIGDLVQISFRGKMALGFSNLPKIGVVKSFVTSRHVCVEWLSAEGCTNMDIDFIESLEKK